MIITRTPFRITIGGGGTDLPSFYRDHGGFVLAAAIDKYMFLNVNTPIVDDKIGDRFDRRYSRRNGTRFFQFLSRGTPQCPACAPAGSSHSTEAGRRSLSHR